MHERHDKAVSLTATYGDHATIDYRFRTHTIKRQQRFAFGKEGKKRGQNYVTRLFLSKICLFCYIVCAGITLDAESSIADQLDQIDANAAATSAHHSFAMQDFGNAAYESNEYWWRS